MVKQAFEEGLAAALKKYCLEKNSGWMDAAKNFASGQAKGLGALVHGARGAMSYDPMGRALGRGLMAGGAQKLLPTAGALGLGALAMAGGPREEQPQQMQQGYPRY